MTDPDGTCAGEDRATPDAWDDPQIAEPWAEPATITPAAVTP